MPPANSLAKNSVAHLRRLHQKELASNLELYYCPTPALRPFERNRLLAYSPTRFVMQDKLDRLPKDALLWNFTAQPSKGIIPLAVMRNKLARKWNDAMRKALKVNGYQCNGRPQPSMTGEQSNLVGLRGTLSVMINNAFGMKESSDVLMENANLIVKILAHQRSPKRFQQAESRSRG